MASSLSALYMKSSNSLNIQVIYDILSP